MDFEARKRLMSEIVNQKTVGGEVAVPLELFFIGNDDLGSIGCNLGAKQPTIQKFYEVLSSLRDHTDVQDIWVRIYDADDESSWPYTDTVYVISSLSKDQIEEALKPLHFDELMPKWMYGKPDAAPEPKQGCTPYSIWWD